MRRTGAAVASIKMSLRLTWRLLSCCPVPSSELSTDTEERLWLWILPESHIDGTTNPAGHREGEQTLLPTKILGFTSSVQSHTPAKQDGLCDRAGIQSPSESSEGKCKKRLEMLYFPFQITYPSLPPK